MRRTLRNTAPRIRPGLALARAAACWLALGAAGLVGCGPDAATPDPGFESFRVDGFSLVDAQGEPADASILDGRYTVLDFFFTSCPIYCPAMGQVMLRVQRATEGTGVRLLSVSVDGEHDTPEVIARYADALGADPERWAFLTGEPDEVRSLSERQLKLGIQVNPDQQVTAPDGEPMDFIDHPTRLILIGPDRQVLGMYSYMRDDEIDRLIRRLDRLARD